MKNSLEKITSYAGLTPSFAMGTEGPESCQFLQQTSRHLTQEGRLRTS